ncbi:peptidase domain-containing ABC transporter [Bacillus sp. Marseille-P3661]|uniref:peptidase domain-containing ABC transporter n=1 Tax=Bacillus sp. Marseille-P3661 TaxID=1936234 RepID=UPI000C84CCCB|nr:peptidase domain-containing ABC transporter [Bacillus sp. Marseille-P3661]
MEVKPLSNHHIFDKVAIFNILDDEEKDRLVNKLEIVNYRLGQTVLSSEENEQALFFILSGKARIISTQADGRELNLGLLSEGDHFGETRLFENHNLDEGTGIIIRASANLTVLKLHKKDFDNLLDSHTELKKYFTDYISNNAMRIFLKRSTVLAPINANELRSLLDKIQIIHFSKGENIVTEGEVGDAFYIISSGTVDVIKDSENYKVLNTLEAGAFFGELALLTGDTRKATVQANDNVQVFKLSKDDFDSLIKRFPKIKDSILSIASGYGQVSNESQQVFDTTVADPELEGSLSETEAVITEDTKIGKFKVRKKRIRLPVILQQSETDCGAASLAMIGRYYNLKLSINKIRELANVTRYGATLLSLAEAAETIGFLSKGIQTDLKGLRNQQLPAIAHWQGNHYIVVYKVTDKEVVVADPGIGLEKIAHEEFEKNWTGTLLILTPTINLKNTDLQENSFQRYLPYFRPHWRTLLEILIVSIFIQILGLALPIFTQIILDDVLVYKNTQLFFIVMMGMIFVSIFSVLFTAIRQYLLVYTFQKIDVRMILDFYQHVMGLPLKYFVERRVGDIISRVNENEKIRNMLSTSTLSTFLDIITLVVYFGLMFFYNIKLAFVSMLFLPMFAILTLAFTPLMKKNSRKAFQANAEMQSHMVEAIGAIQTVKAINAERKVRWNLENKLENVAKVNIKTAILNVSIESLSSWIKTLSSFSVLFYGSYLVLNGDLSVGQLMAFTVLLTNAIDPVTRIIQFWDEYQEVRISIERLNDVFDAELEEAEPDKMLRIPSIKGQIAFENVTFRYEQDGKNILQNINLQVYPGQTVALVGRSGAGKSTFANLILKLFKPSTGKITIDGYDLNQISVSSLRRQIGVVQQENVLFSGTIRENIAYHYPDSSYQDIVTASMLAGAHEFITALPLGYETVIGERGMNLSGGQRQRIAIARALLGKPKILIFDEATSALDTESEKIIQKNMGLILKDRTTFIIAHRLSTIREADMIVVLDQGIIIEVGNHDQLMSRRGLYYYLNKQQLDQ